MRRRELINIITTSQCITDSTIEKFDIMQEKERKMITSEEKYNINKKKDK